MRIANKEIKAETISLWLNVIGFIVGILFYVRMEHRTKSEPTTNQIHDTVLVIESKLKTEIQHLKVNQDSLLQEIKQNNELIKKQTKSLTVLRQQLNQVINSDWDNLSESEQNAFINQTLQQLKNHNVP